MKKIISILLAAAFITSCMPHDQNDDLEAAPASAYKSEDLTPDAKKDALKNSMITSDTVKDKTTKDDPPPKDGQQWKISRQ